MNLITPIVFIDIESACPKLRPDAAVDKIICLSAKKLSNLTPSVRKTWLFNPGIEMSQENQDIHGYTNEMVKSFPILTAVHANEIGEFLAGCDLGGFNLYNYDVPLLFEELYRVGVTLELEGVNIVDAGNVFKKKEERSLTAAMKFYCGKDHAGAHGAEADVDATIEVLEAQLQRYPDLMALDLPALAKFSKMDERVDLFGTISRNARGEPVFNTKRNQGVRVVDDPGYAQWMLRSDFPANTKRVITKILEADETEEDLFAETRH